MKFYLSMPAGLRPTYEYKLEQSNATQAEGLLQIAWRYLGRAHVLDQPWAARGQSNSIIMY